MGVYPWPGTRGHSDGNEASAPYTPRIKAEDSFRVQDPALAKARAGGVTTIMVLPGSANLIGGEAAILKNRPSRTLAGMKFNNAPRGIKMACGENPKRVYKRDFVNKFQNAHSASSQLCCVCAAITTGETR